MAGGTIYYNKRMRGGRETKITSVFLYTSSLNRLQIRTYILGDSLLAFS